MTAPEEKTVAAGDIPGRPARAAESERGEHDAASVLSLDSGAGPEQSREDCMASQRPPARPDRPVRFADPAQNAAYWERIDALVAEAPPLTEQQKIRIRAAFLQSAQNREAA